MNFSWVPLNCFSWIQTHVEGLLWSVYTYNISVTDSLPVYSRYDVTVVGYQCRTFWSSFSEKKLLLLAFSRCVWGAEWKELFVFCKYISSWCLEFDGISNVVLNFFSNRCSSCFCRSDVFSFNIGFTCYWEFIALLSTFNVF